MGKFSKFLLLEKIVALNEALPLSVARRMTKLSNGAYKETYPELFGDDPKKHRIYIPYEGGDSKSETQQTVEDLLRDNGFEEIFYKDNKAIKKKQQYKIGKVLNQISPELLDRYKKDREFGSDEKLLICISRHPYDIAGASTDRPWISCMTLQLDLNKFKLTQNPSEGEILAHTQGGTYRDFIDCDIQMGVLVAYLIKETDKNINSPIARTLIKPYLSDFPDNDMILQAMDKVYSRIGVGKITQRSFVAQVQKFLDEKWNKDYSGVFKHLESLYNDDAPDRVIKNKTITNKKDLENLLEKLGLEDYRINKDMSVDINEDVDISNMNLTTIPIKFGIVKGDFTCNNNNLTSLENCPKKVFGDFDCSFNERLTSLVGCPIFVKDSFEANNLENLITIDGMITKTKVVNLTSCKNLAKISSNNKIETDWLYIINCDKLLKNYSVDEIKALMGVKRKLFC